MDVLFLNIQKNQLLRDIKIVYSPGNQTFKQEKSITITANTDPETTVLKVYANMIPTEDPHADGF